VVAADPVDGRTCRADRRRPTPARAAATAYAFGLGWFLSGIWWLFISMHVYGEMPSWMAGLAVVLFAGYLSIWPALAGAAWHWLTTRPQRRASRAGVRRHVGALEWLRGVVFTGFPWLGSGYPHTDGPLAGFAPLIGVYGISALAGFIAALLVAVVGAIGRQRKARSAVLAGGLAVGVLACGAALAPIQYTSPIGQPIHVRLLQGNVAQDIKFEPVGIERSLELYRDLITEAPADLVVTPETAFPVILQELPVEIARAVRTFMEKTGTTIIFGAAGADSPVSPTACLRSARNRISSTATISTIWCHSASSSRSAFDGSWT
jgi:apolipoprotein N-acyltransferase